MVDPVDLKEALRRQWARVAVAATQLDLETPSRVGGWRNAEVLAHLAVQPLLLGRFLAGAGAAEATMRLEDNLGGTHALAERIDTAAKEGAEAGHVDFARKAATVDAALAAADIDATVTTLQGAISLADYLRTRCVEAVVHGMDLQPPVSPDPGALSVTVEALMRVLNARSATLAAECQLPATEFVDVATGRRPPPPSLARVMPLMT